MDGQGLFAYAVFSITEKCEFKTNTDVKVELRMWEGKAAQVTGGSLDNIKSEIISDKNLITTTMSPVSFQFDAPSCTNDLNIELHLSILTMNSTKCLFLNLITNKKITKNTLTIQVPSG